MTQNRVQMSLKMVRLKCHAIISQKIGDDCCTIVRLSFDAIVRWDYRPNHNTISSLMVQRYVIRYNLNLKSLCLKLIKLNLEILGKTTHTVLNGGH